MHNINLHSTLIDDQFEEAVYSWHFNSVLLDLEIS